MTSHDTLKFVGAMSDRQIVDYIGDALSCYLINPMPDVLQDFKVACSLFAVRELVNKCNNNPTKVFGTVDNWIQFENATKDLGL